MLRSNSNMPSPRWLLHRRDQATVAGLALLALVAMGLFWLIQGGHRNQLIDIDRADPIEVQFLVDINQADIHEFVVLPDVGITLAKRIVQYRQEHGPYQSIDDLRHVRGIGPKIFERLKPYVRTVTSEATVAGGE